MSAKEDKRKDAWQMRQTPTDVQIENCWLHRIMARCSWLMMWQIIECSSSITHEYGPENEKKKNPKARNQVADTTSTTNPVVHKIKVILCYDIVQIGLGAPLNFVVWKLIMLTHSVGLVLVDRRALRKTRVVAIFKSHVICICSFDTRLLAAGVQVPC